MHINAQKKIIINKNEKTLSVNCYLCLNIS